MIPNHNRFSHQLPIMANPGNGTPALELNRLTFSNKKLENINCIFRPSDNMGGLYLGDVVSTLKEDLLKNNNIRAILTCMCQSNFGFTLEVSINPIVNCHKILPIKDILEYPIIYHFDDAVAWIDQRRKQRHNVLVHCHAGVSRSVTIVVAYLIRTQKWNPFQALEFVKQQRQRAKPNASFWNQINQYYNYWSRQPAINQQIQSTNSSKENKSNVIQQPHKMASQQVLPKRVEAYQSKKEEIVAQKRMEPTEKPNLLNQKVETQMEKNKEQKISISRRKKIFQKPHFPKGISQKTKTEQIISQYYINPSKISSSIKPHVNTHLHNSSIILEDSRFLQHKSALQPRNSIHSESLMKSRIDQPALISGKPSMRPQIKFTQEPMQNSFLSPFETRSIIRNP